MVITVNKSDFADAMASVSKVIPSRPSVPVLRGVVLEVEDGVLSVSGTDSQTTIMVTVPADVAEVGRVVVPGRVLAAIAGRLPNRPVEIALDGQSLIVKCGQSRFDLPVMDVDRFPTRPTMPEQVGRIDGDLLLRMAKRVGVAASNDESLPMLTGVDISADDGGITFAATDRFRLAVDRAGWDGNPVKALVPYTALMEAVKHTPGREVAVHAGGSSVGFTAGNFSIITGLIDAEFPAWQKLVPDSVTTAVTIDAAALTDAIQRVGIVADNGAQVRFVVEGGVVTLCANGVAEGAASEVLECAVWGEDVTVAFNPNYLRGALVSHVGEVVLGVNGASRPGVVVPGGHVVDGVVEGVDGVHIVMPVRLG